MSKQQRVDLSQLSPQQLQVRVDFPRPVPAPHSDPPSTPPMGKVKFKRGVGDGSSSLVDRSPPHRPTASDLTVRPNPVVSQSSQQMGEQIEGEIEQLKQNMAQLQNGVKRYHTSGRAIEALKDETGGKEMLVPLTSSLYVPGILGDTDTILLDIGTGYFVEKSPEDGVDYCKRKVNMVRENMEKLLEFIQQKQNQAAQVNQVFNAKVMQMQEQQKTAEAQGV